MRKKISLLLFAVIAMLVFTTNVNAANTCSSTSLYDEKLNVSEMNAEYEIVEEEKHDPKGDPEYWLDSYLLVKILNVPDNVKVNVESLNDTFDNFSLSSSSKDEDNMLTIKDDNALVLRRYKFTVVSTSQECGGETLKTITLNTPMYNTYSDSASCIKYPDFKYCQMFVDYDITSLSNTEFIDSFDKYIEELENKDKEDEKGITEGIKKAVSKYWIVIVVLIILVGGLVTYIVIKKKRSKII